MVVFDYQPGKRKGQLICDEYTLASVRNHFSVSNSAKDHVRDPVKKRFIKDRKYALTPTGLFDFGLYNEIRKFLIQEQITEIKYTPKFKARVLSGFKDYVFWDELKNPPRYFQTETVEQCLKYGYGTYVVGTGGGKSYIQALLVENMKRLHFPNFKCLIVVPGIGLVQQLMDDFKDYEVTFTFSGWTGEKLKNDYTKPLQDTEVIICNSEMFIRHFGANPWIADVDMFIADECHKINSTANISKLIEKIKTPHKFGFTGSLSNDLMDRWKTLGIFGPVLYEKKSKELRDEGFLVEVETRFLQLIHNRPPSRMTYKQELPFLYRSPERNELIKNLVKRLKNNTLIIVNHLEHGETIKEKLQGIGRQVFFVKGEMSVKERDAIKRLMETDDDIVCVAMASIFSTGINIKNLHNIVLVGLGKSFIRLVQTIGRGLRLHEFKDKLTIYDLYDNMKYSTNHADERKLIYDEEQIKWKETIISL